MRHDSYPLDCATLRSHRGLADIRGRLNAINVRSLVAVPAFIGQMLIGM